MIYRRDELPQLTKQKLTELGLPFTEMSLQTWKIRPTQNELRPQTEERYLKILRNTYKPLIVDKDYILVDGHHRLDLLLKMQIQRARVLVVGAPFQEILQLSQK